MTFASVAATQQIPGGLSDPMIAAFEGYAGSIREWQSAFEDHRETPHAADLVRRILAPGGFIDRHATAMDLWVEELRSGDTTHLGEVVYLHNGNQAFIHAAWEAVHLMDRLELGEEFGPIDPGAARSRIEELTDRCYFAQPGSTVEECQAPQRTRVLAAWPEETLEGVYDDEATHEFDLPVVNEGDHTAEALRVAVGIDIGFITSVTTPDGSCARGRPWVCELGDLAPGGRQLLRATVDCRADDDPEITATDRLVVTASSPVTDLEPEYAVGGFDWDVRDCDERYRRQLRRLPAEDFAEAAQKARKPNLDLPGYALFFSDEPGTDPASREYHSLVTEAIAGHGADRQLADGAGTKYHQALVDIISDMSGNATCDDDPTSRLEAAEEQRRAFLARKDHISRMSRDATDLAIAREIEFRATMSIIQPGDPSGGDIAMGAGEKAAGVVANSVYRSLRAKGLVAGAVPEVAGPIGLLISIGEILQSAGEVAWLIEAKFEKDAAMSAIEAAAYLEGLIDRYAALEKAQDQFREAILDTYRSECVCIK